MPFPLAVFSHSGEGFRYQMEVSIQVGGLPFKYQAGKEKEGS